MILFNFIGADHRSIWEFILDLKSASWDILSRIFQHDFSFLYEEIFGWSILDLLSIAFAFWMLKEIFSWFGHLLTTALNDLTHNGLSQIVNVSFVIGRRIILRAWYTLEYAWGLPFVQRQKVRMLLSLQSKFLTSFSHLKKRLS